MPILAYRGKRGPMSYLSICMLACLWCVFAVAGWSKIRSRAARRAFAGSLRSVPMLPARLVGPATVTVTVAEIALVPGLGWSAVAMASGWPAARGGAALVLGLTGLLLAVLTTGVVLAVRRGTGARCACFGAAERPLGRRHVARNGILLAVAAVALVSAAGQRGPLPLAGVLVAGAAGAVGALILIRLDDLVELFLPVRTATPTARTPKR